MTAHTPNPSGVSAGQLFRILTSEQRKILVASFLEAIHYSIEYGVGPTSETLEVSKFIEANWNGK